MKLCILVAYESYKKCLRSVSAFLVISEYMEFIRLYISHPFLKIKTSGVDQKFFKIMCKTFHCFWGHQVHFWSRDWA